MNFDEAAQKYSILEQNWKAGLVTEEVYGQALTTLRVVDQSGLTWMIQKHTGRWFVFRDRQWVAAVPPAPQRGNMDTPPAQPMQPTAPAGRRRATGWLLPAGILMAVCCLGAAAVGAYQLLKPTSGIVSTEENPGSSEIIPSEASGATRVTFQPVQTITLGAGENQSFGAQGETLTILPSALPTSTQLEVTTSQPDAGLSGLLKDAFQAEPVFYQLLARGENDGTGSATVNVPAAHGAALLMEVIDERYFAFTEIPTQNGQFIVNLPIGGAEKDAADESVSLKGSARFAILQFDPPTTKSGSIHTAALTQAPDPRSCGVDIQVASYSYMAPPTHKTVSFCRKNLPGTVQVMVYPPETPNVTSQMADQVAGKVEAIMSLYQSKGFSAAKLEDAWQKRVMVVIEAGSGDPYYSSVNGVVHIPQDSLSSGYGKNLDYELAHELAHWVQDEAYNFTSSYWASFTGVSSESKWWFEVSADNMAFLYNPSFIELNLTTYGMTTPVTQNTPFQYAPNQWNDQLYLHAQLVKVFMCGNADACPISEDSFAAAINNGTFPYDAGALAKIGPKLDNYAAYLLGKPPTSANSAIPGNASLTNGTGYGEFIQVGSSEGKPVFKKTGYAPQMEEVSADKGFGVKISANLQASSAYPLTVSAVDKAGQEGFPVELVVEPGASFYYTLDNGAVKFHDGKTRLTISPIHAVVGYRKVRIVALSVNGGEVFAARVQPLSLEGTWVVTVSGAKTTGAMTCEGEGWENPDGTALLMAYITEMGGGLGEMTADPTGLSYDYTQVDERVPAEFVESQVSFQATALLAGKGIRYQSLLDIPRPSEDASLPPAVPLAAAGFFPALWLCRKRLSLTSVRVITNILVIGVIVLVSTGCVGIGMYGSAQLDATFDKVEFVGGKDTGLIVFSGELNGVPQGQPLWKMTGSGSYDVTFNIESTVVDQDGNEETEIATCTGQVTFPLTAYIYQDFVVQIQSED